MRISRCLGGVPLSYLLIALMAVPLQSAIPTSERDALIAFYNSTNGSSWNNNSGWLGGAGTECSWYGVTCDPNETTVTALWTENNNLSGSIPPDLGQLSNLFNLSLQGNQLGGSIPSELGQLSNLISLALNDNNLTGPIPGELGQLNSLGDLWLYNNQLSGSIPSELGQLSNLVRLFLNDNRLSGAIPPELGQLNSLGTLLLSGNTLTGPIPGSFANLAYLSQEYGYAGGYGLSYNGVSTSDPSLNAILDSVFGDWSTTQTLPPANAGVSNISAYSVTLTWSPIEYTGDQGRYEVYISDSQGGPFSLAKTTSNKASSGATVSNLSPGEDWYFKVCSVTDPHANNSNTVRSEFTEVVSATTLTEASVVVTHWPSGMDQLAGSGGATDSFRLKNEGEVATTITLSREGNFFTQSPSSFTLDPGASRTVTMTGRAMPAGVYKGYSIPSGDGVPEGLRIPVTLRSWDQPAITIVPESQTILVGNAASYSVKLVGSWLEDLEIGLTSADPGVASLRSSSLVIPRESTTVSFLVDGLTAGGPVTLTATLPESVEGGSADATLTVIEEPGEPRVVFTRHPSTLVQVAGQAGATTALALKNLGSRSTAITMMKEGTNFFEQGPESFTLDPKGVQVVNVAGLAQDEGLYEGFSVATGDGADDLRVRVRLFSKAPPLTGTPRVVTHTPRIDVIWSGDESVGGSVTLVNIGTATATGIIDADQPWVTLPTSILTIEPGETIDVDFTIDPSRAPEDVLEEGAFTIDITFSYLASESELTASVTESDSSDWRVATTTSAVLVTPVIGGMASAIPPLAAGEVALLVPGVRKSTTGDLGFSTDLSLTNLQTNASLSGVEIYYRPLDDVETSSKATVDVIPLAQAVSYRDTFGAFEIDTGVGTLMIRSDRNEQIGVQVSQVAKRASDRTLTSTKLPVFRSDRARTSGESFVLNGLDMDEPMHTEIFVQEAHGVETLAEVVLYDESGAELLTRSVELEPFGIVRLSSIEDSLPEGAILAVVNVKSGGAVVGYAMTTNFTTGHSWPTVDWRLVYESDPRETWCVTLSGNVDGRPARRRPVRTGDPSPGFDLVRASEMVLTNSDAEGGEASVTYRSRLGPSRATESIVLQPYESYRVADVIEELFGMSRGSGGMIDVVAGEDAGRMTITTRSYVEGDEARTTVPAQPVRSAIAVGESITITGLEDSDRKNVNAKTAGTLRTTLGLIEVGGGDVRVRVSVHFLIPGSLAAFLDASPLGSVEFELGPGEWRTLRDLVRSVLGPDRDDVYGYLRDVRVIVEVLEGEGRVMTYTYSVDNATGEMVAPLN